MKIRFLNLAMVCLLGGVAFTSSCRKDKTEDEPKASDSEAAQEMTLADQFFSDLKNISDEAESGSTSSFKNGMSFASCATVNLDKANKKITVDFGSSNCLCRDLRLRRGVLNISYTANYWDSGNVITIVPQDYYVNDHKLDGTKKITNLGLDANNNPHWKVEVNGQVIKANNGGTIGWNCIRTSTWANGSSTPINWTDDEWVVDGTARLTTTSQVVWDIDITKSLHRAMSCYYIDEGTVEFNTAGLATRTVDYGNGACDNDATYSVSGVTIPFKLR